MNMNTQSHAVSGSAVEAQKVAFLKVPALRPLYWSIRREFWEHRWLYVAPIVIAGVALLAFIFGATAGIWIKRLSLNHPNHLADPQGPYDIVSGLMMGVVILGGVFYSAEALQGERRDRSILFWKAMPVSDTTTVLAKASIPLIFLPLIAIGVAIATHILMLLVSSIILTASGQGAGTMWAHLSVFRMWMLMSYHILTNHALWPFPIYCYLLLVSAWSRRAPLLWAALPIVAISGVEKLVTRTSHFLTMLGSRLIGDAPTIVHSHADMFPTNPMTHLTMGTFLASSGLWLGLLVSAIFLIAAIRVRRYQGPN